MVRSQSASACTTDSTEVIELPVKDVDEILCTSQDIYTVPLTPIVTPATLIINDAQLHQRKSNIIIEDIIVPEEVKNVEGAITEILQEEEETFHDTAETTENMQGSSDDDSETTDNNDDEEDDNNEEEDENNDDENNEENPQDEGISTVNEARRDVYDEHDPMDLLGVATVRAASIASIIAKQVYDGAASSVQALFGTQQACDEKPARNFTRDQVHYTSAMDQLLEMGFGNREQNSRLLTKFEDNIHLTVQALLADEDQDWSGTRH
ncbi:uncharacterized protein [Antedon mediterranea]|uniref:uncharacterized protein n=1 Tax=Antedon mediterranea TaxID=105859 RepID=UPI003AF8BD70